MGGGSRRAPATSALFGAGFAAGLLWVTATTTGYELFRQYRLGQADRAERRAIGSGLIP